MSMETSDKNPTGDESLSKGIQKNGESGSGHWTKEQERKIITDIDRFTTPNQNQRPLFLIKEFKEKGSLFEIYFSDFADFDIPFDPDNVESWFESFKTYVLLEATRIEKSHYNDVHPEFIQKLRKNIENAIDNFSMTYRDKPKNLISSLQMRVLGSAFAKTISAAEPYFVENEDTVIETSTIKPSFSDSYMGQIGTVLSLKKDTEGKESQTIDMGCVFVWGSKQSTPDTVASKINYIIEGILGRGDLKPMFYTALNSSKSLPSSIPSVVIAGDQSHTNALISGAFVNNKLKEMQQSHNPILFNAIEQIIVQLELYRDCIGNIIKDGQYIHSYIFQDVNANNKLNSFLKKYNELVDMWVNIRSINKYSIQKFGDSNDIMHQILLQQIANLQNLNNIPKYINEDEEDK